jgi:hypothetical protein
LVNLRVMQGVSQIQVGKLKLPQRVRVTAMDADTRTTKTVTVYGMTVEQFMSAVAALGKSPDRPARRAKQVA